VFLKEKKQHPPKSSDMHPREKPCASEKNLCQKEKISVKKRKSL
jgi:hypothetical protein